MIELVNTTKTFELNKNHTTTPVKNFNLKVAEGEVVVLKGASGSGKSTILSLIAALAKPTSGEVLVDKKKISKLPDNFAADYRRDNIGFIFQKYNLIAQLSVEENILIPLAPLNLKTQLLEQMLESVLHKFKIIHKRDEIVKTLSGGEQQRVAIARANINNPKIIIADEPTANLDKELSYHFIEILQELKNEGKTIIIATHDPIFEGLGLIDKVIEL